MTDHDQLKSDADTAFRAGRLADARALYEEALRARPDWVAVHNNLAMALRALGGTDEAESHFRSAIDLDPDQTGALSNLGALLIERGNLADARAALDRAMALAPDQAGINYNCGLLAAASDEPQAAADFFEAALAANPGYAPAYANLGIAYRQLDRLDEAEAALRRAIDVDPNLFEAHLNLSTVLMSGSAASQDEAHASCQRALELKPDSPQAHYNMGNALVRAHDYQAALDHYEHALTLDPEHAGAANNRLRPLSALGRFDDMIETLRRAIRIDPETPEWHSNLVLRGQYDPNATAKSLFSAARTWNEAFKPSEPPVLANVPADPDRRLRIGFVSGNFAGHPVGYFVLPVLTAHDRDQFEMMCYASQVNGDAITHDIMSAADSWIPVRRDSDADLVQRIRDDKIDILVDLDGHSNGGRLGVFARRAAPLQVTWAGYAGTTGIDAMDYLITDRRETPDADLPYVSEQPVYMPGNYVTVAPFQDAPDVGTARGADGAVTFGCFNNLDKVNDGVIAVWARILNAVHNSRLCLITEHLADPAVAGRTAAAFVGHGIRGDRLDLCGKRPHVELLAAYNQIDIALDPFPYSGGLTTLEALWMGTPVITRGDGDRFAGRHSVTHLTAVGVPELIAKDADDYVARAVALANDPDRRARYHATLREQMRASPACDGEGFTRALERACRIMWRRACAGEPPAPITEGDLRPG